VAGVDDVGEAWEANAQDWLAWTRAADHDHHHSLFNFPAFVGLLPDGSHRILDVGCGEGRVGRWLSAHGHTVVGIDSSPTLANAARESGGYEAVVTGDAGRLPWPEHAFDLAVAYMALHDMPDAAAVTGEIARVLRPGGWLALAVIHPLSRSDESLDRYFEEVRFQDDVTREGLTMRFNGVARPISYYTRALLAHGFVIDRLTEPRPTADMCSAAPRLSGAARRPYFLHLRGRLAS
jgi:SAM-dependent methyltransferase